MRKLLIIKTGHAETFNESVSSDTSSLGDVLRTTFILHYYKEDFEIDWLTSVNAVPLIKNKFVSRVFSTIDNILLSSYDLIINLEKNEELLENLNQYHSTIGFYKQDGILRIRGKYIDNTYGKVLEELKYESNTYEIILSTILGFEWKYEKTILDYPSNTIKNSVGLNWKVGTKWPEKMIHKKWWDELAASLSESSNVEWQQGFDDLVEYIEWISRLETLVTLDSLGLHIGLALNKRIIALFGPTNMRNVELYELGTKLCYNSDNLDDVSSEILETIS